MLRFCTVPGCHNQTMGSICSTHYTRKRRTGSYDKTAVHGNTITSGLNLIGQNLLEYRIKRGIKRDTLAAELGVSPGYLSHLSKRNPSLSTIEKLAKALKIETWQLLKPHYFLEND